MRLSYPFTTTLFIRRRAHSISARDQDVSTQTFSPEVKLPTLPTEQSEPSLRRQPSGPALRILQPEVTYTGAPIKPLQKGLPKQTESLCPECNQVIAADIFADDGKVVMQKRCAEHGQFRDIVFSDVELYLKMEEWNFGDNLGLSNPQVEGGKSCPDDCGLCGMHTSHTALANVDLTNRCNLTCPVCFANANIAGYLYEPDLEQVRGMLATLRGERPVDGRVVQFSGGEPTDPSAVLRDPVAWRARWDSPTFRRRPMASSWRIWNSRRRRKRPGWRRSICSSTA